MVYQWTIICKSKLFVAIGSTKEGFVPWLQVTQWERELWCVVCVTSFIKKYFFRIFCLNQLNILQNGIQCLRAPLSHKETREKVCIFCIFYITLFNKIFFLVLYFIIGKNITISGLVPKTYILHWVILL